MKTSSDSTSSSTTLTFRSPKSSSETDNKSLRHGGRQRVSVETDRKGAVFDFLQKIGDQKAPDRVLAISAETRKYRKGGFLQKKVISAERGL